MNQILSVHGEDENTKTELKRYFLLFHRDNYKAVKIFVFYFTEKTEFLTCQKVWKKRKSKKKNSKEIEEQEKVEDINRK